MEQRVLQVFEPDVFLVTISNFTREEKMGDRLIPKSDELKLDIPWQQRFGLGASAVMGWQWDTAISDGDGMMYGFNVDLEYAETFRDIYKFYLQMIWGSSDGKILPTGGPTVPTTRRSTLFGGGKDRILYTGFNDAGKHPFSLYTNSQYLMGWGKTVRENAYSSEESSTSTFDVASALYIGTRFNLGRQLQLNIAPGFLYGVQYAGKDSEHNRLRLAFMLNAEFGWGASNIISGDNPDTEVGAAGNAMEIYRMFHAIMLRYAMNATLADQQQAIGDYGIDSSGSGKGPLSIVPTFMAGSTLIGGFGDSISVPLRSELFWAFVAANAVDGVVFTAMEGDAGRIGGISNILKSARMGIGYPIFDIESVEKRRALPDAEKEKREEYVNLGSYLLNTTVQGIGQAAGSDVVATAGANANIPVAFKPNQVTDMLESRLYIPSWAVLSNRFGFTFHNSWKHLPLASGVNFLYAGSDENIDINSFLALQWDSRYHYLFAGLNNNTTFGEGAGSSVGFTGGVGVKIADTLVLDARTIINPWRPGDETGDKINLLFGATLHL